MSMPCPLDGKCIYNTYPTTAKHVCALPNCIYPEEQRRALIRAITALAVKPTATRWRKKSSNDTGGTSGSSTTGAVIRNHGQ